MADQIQPTARRLAYIDWMRGLACVLMFQTHCYDSWMSPEAKKSSSLTGWSKLGGTLPAPLFIFFGGRVVCAGDGKLREKGIERKRHREANDFARRGKFLGWGYFFACRNLRSVIPGRRGRICCASTSKTFFRAFV